MNTLNNDNTNGLSKAELIIAYLIDNQLISGADAIILIKEIHNNQEKQPDLAKTLLPKPKQTPNTQNPWQAEPYNPIKIWYGESEHFNEPQTSVAVPVDMEPNVYTSQHSSNLNESKVFNRK